MEGLEEEMLLGGRGEKETEGEKGWRDDANAVEGGNKERKRCVPASWPSSRS